MAWLRSMLRLPLLLPLLPLLWVPTEAEDRKVVLLASPEVNGSLGDTVNLACVLQTEGSEILQVKHIKWEKLQPWGNLSIVAEFELNQDPRIEEPDRVQFVAAGKDQEGPLMDASLTLTDLYPDDEANYTCEVTTVQQGIGRATTWLRVFYAPEVSIFLFDDSWQQESRETSLNCYADSNPEPISYEWSTITGALPPYAEPQDDWLMLQPSEESINITFICTVSNALGTGQDSINVLLPGFCSKQPQSSSALTISLIVALVAVVLVAVVLVTLVYFWLSRKLRQDRRSTLKNEAHLLRPQDRTASEHCRSEMEEKASDDWKMAIHP